MGSYATSPFSEYAEQVRVLKLKDRHFLRLYEELTQVNQTITALSEQDNQTEKLQDLKIRRVYLTEKLQEKLQEQEP